MSFTTSVTRVGEFFVIWATFEPLVLEILADIDIFRATLTYFGRIIEVSKSADISGTL